MGNNLKNQHYKNMGIRLQMDTLTFEAERFGFIVLEYYMDGYFENNSNYDNAEDLYHHLLDKWKFCWIVDKARVNGTEEFEDYEPSLTKEQRTERDKALAHFEEAFRQIQTE